MTPEDVGFMRRAIALADRSRGVSEPNPTVGCVVVRAGVIVGEGFTDEPGGPHAEARALATAGERAKGATLYTTLEPCCHAGGGKRTPPCVPRLLEAGVGRVVVGCQDPNPRVSGEGNRQLRSAGVEVVTGVLEETCRVLIWAFEAGLRGRPFVTLKWAVSADGRVAGRRGRPVRITGEASTAAVHQLRGRCDAIAIGTNTLVNDDPLLTARVPDAPRRPVRIVLSNSLKFPQGRRLFETPECGPVWIVTSAAGPSRLPGHVETLRLPAKDNGRGGKRFDLDDAYRLLAERGITHLLVEPGPKLAEELLARGQADRVWELHGTVTIGDEGLAAPTCDWPVAAEGNIGDDRLVERVREGPLAPSSDFRLATCGRGA
jgi:diaminohydroxyphosphoribosylaminopyrimidine deaminase/5-amino-6-(5-phosphoribosylamino)uracil reductase